MKNNPIKKTHILLLISIASIISILFIGPIAQNQEYHLFADRRTLFSIPNFWNVISNIPFIIAGVFGIFYCFREAVKTSDYQSVAPVIVFFVGIFLTGIGSSYYHLNPSNETLFWDRLPMTISFMAFFTIVIRQYISVKRGGQFFIPLLFIGIFSLKYWQITERSGIGDLRLYILVQFLPIVLIIVILLLYKKSSCTFCFIQILGIYLIAKLFETTDKQIYSHYIISGHSIKHLIASFAPFIFLHALYTGKVIIKTNQAKPH